VTMPPQTPRLGAQIARNSKALIQPFLIAIYSPRSGATGTIRPQQTATGFLLSWYSQPCLVTAKHSLYGTRGDENPHEKLIFVDGALQNLADLKAATHPDPGRDLAIVLYDKLDQTRCLPHSSITCTPPEFVTIQGYLARDFKRAAISGGVFAKPFVYSNKATKRRRSLSECFTHTLGGSIPSLENASEHRNQAAFPGAL
jgi:hypothetical protein